MNWLGQKYKQELFLPNVYLDQFEMDLMRLTTTGYVIEYEIKISRSDFKNDSKKGRVRWGKLINKHEKLKNGKSKSNRFYYVVPEHLVTADEVPEFAGLMYHIPNTEVFYVVKNAPMMHKNKAFKTIKDFIKLAIKCSIRERSWRERYNKLKNGSGKF